MNVEPLIKTMLEAIAERKRKIDVLMQEILQAKAEANCKHNAPINGLDESDFDEASYQKLKEYFLTAYRHFENEITDTRSFAFALVKTLRYDFGFPPKAIVAMKPYLVQFVTDIENGVIDPTSTTDSENTQNFHLYKISATKL